MAHLGLTLLPRRSSGSRSLVFRHDPGFPVRRVARTRLLLPPLTITEPRGVFDLAHVALRLSDGPDG